MGVGADAAFLTLAPFDTTIVGGESLLFTAAVASLTVCLLVFLREILVAAVSARQTVSPQAARTRT